MAVNPEILWAQRNDIVYLTIQVADLHNEKLDLDAQHLAFSGTGNESKSYACEIEFYAPIVPEESKQYKTGQNRFFILKKADSGTYWPRLLKASGPKPRWLKTDFSRWKDEDEEAEEEIGGGDSPFMNGNPFEGMGMQDFAFMQQQTAEIDSDDEPEQPEQEEEEEEESK